MDGDEAGNIVGLQPRLLRSADGRKLLAVDGQSVGVDGQEVAPQRQRTAATAVFELQKSTGQAAPLQLAALIGLSGRPVKSGDGAAK